MCFGWGKRLNFIVVPFTPFYILLLSFRINSVRFVLCHFTLPRISSAHAIHIMPLYRISKLFINLLPYDLQQIFTRRSGWLRPTIVLVSSSAKTFSAWIFTKCKDGLTKHRFILHTTIPLGIQLQRSFQYISSIKACQHYAYPNSM
jgi:hypothetical protein